MSSLFPTTTTAWGKPWKQRVPFPQDPVPCMLTCWKEAGMTREPIEAVTFVELYPIELGEPGEIVLKADFKQCCIKRPPDPHRWAGRMACTPCCFQGSSRPHKKIAAKGTFP